MERHHQLINRTQFLPGESLPSLVWRLALRNYYNPPGIIIQLLMKHGRDKHLLCPPISPKFFENLSAISSIPPVELYARTVHPFTKVLMSFKRNTDQLVLDTRTLPVLPKSLIAKYMYNVNAAQYCPYCLRQACYHRHIWIPVAVSACVKHQCILKNNCPNCQRAVSIRSVVKNECVYCKSQLDGTEATKISEDEKGLLAQNMIQLWFEGGNNFGDLAGIPEQPAELLFRIVDGIRFCLMSQRQLWEFFPRLGNLPPLSKGQKLFSHVSFALYSTAFEALTNWPLGFYQFLETYARAGSNRTLHQDLPILYSQWIQYRWKKPEFKFLQTAFDDYVAQYYDPSASVITSTRFRNNEKFIARLGYTTLQTVVNKVGLSKAIVIGLIKEGLIVAEAHPELDNHHQWIINKESVDRFLEDIRCNTFNDRRAEFAVDLKTASKMVASVDLNVVKLITYIATGRLGAVWTSRHLRDLRLNKSEIESLVHSIKQENGWISRHEVARRIGVKPTIISKWVETGLIQPIASYANAQHFDQKTIESFVRDHIFSDEAADILGVDVIVVQKWARKGRLKPVVGGDDSISHRYLFRRKDVELLRPENRLTAPQMAKRLGISRSQMFVWIKYGKVKPISGPGIDDCKHYLFVL